MWKNVLYLVNIVWQVDIISFCVDVMIKKYIGYKGNRFDAKCKIVRAGNRGMPNHVSGRLLIIDNMLPAYSHHRWLVMQWFMVPLLLSSFNSSLSGQNGRHLADDISIYVLVNERFCIVIKISLKFAPKGRLENNPTLVQIMAWYRTGLGCTEICS